jgi:hypothetical protein
MSNNHIERQRWAMTGSERQALIERADSHLSIARQWQLLKVRARRCTIGRHRGQVAVQLGDWHQRLLELLAVAFTSAS